ncbi:unnamed protein product [Absidia cylindrospora]
MLFYLLLLLEFLYNVYCAVSHPVEWVIVRVGNVVRCYQNNHDALWRMLLAVPGWLLLNVANWVMFGFLGLAPGFSLEPIRTSMTNLFGARCQDVRKLDSTPVCHSKSGRSVTLRSVRMTPVSLAPLVSPVPTLSVVHLTPVFAYPVPTVPVGLRGVSCAVQTEPVLLSGGGVSSCAVPTEPATPVSSGASCAVQPEPVATVSLAPSVLTDAPSVPSARDVPDVSDVSDVPVVCPPPPPLATLPVVPVPDVSAFDAVDVCGIPAAADDFINAGQVYGMAAVAEIDALRPRASVDGKAKVYCKPSRRLSHATVTRPIARSGPHPVKFKRRCIAVMRSRVLSSAEAVDEDEGMGSPCTDSNDATLGCGDEALDGVKRLCSWSRCHLVGTLNSHSVQFCTAARTALFKCWSTIVRQHSVYFKVQKRQMVWSPIFGLVDAASACVMEVVDDMDAEEVVVSPLVVGGGVFPAPSGPLAPAQLVPLFPPVPTLPPAVPVLAPVTDPVFCCKTPMAIGPSAISKYDRAREPRVATARKPAPLAKDSRVASATTVPADDVSARKLPACAATCSPLASSSSVVAACPQPADDTKNAVGTVNAVLCQSAKSDGDSDETTAASEALEGDEASASGDHAGPPPTAAAVPAPPNDPVSGCKTQLATASVQVPLVATAPKPAPLVLDKQVTVPVSEPAPVTPASVVMKAPHTLSSSIAPLVKASSFFVLAAAPCPMSAADKMKVVDDATAVMDRLDDLGDSATLQDKLDAVGFATAVLDALKGMEDLASGDSTDPSHTMVDPVCPSSLPVSVASDDPPASLKGARDVAASASSDPVMTSKKASGNVASSSAARASVTTMVEPTRAPPSASVVASDRETVLTQVFRRPPIRAKSVDFPTRPASKRPAVSSPPPTGPRRRVDSKDRGVPESSRKTAKPRRYRSKKR